MADKTILNCGRFYKGDSALTSTKLPYHTIRIRELKLLPGLYIWESAYDTLDNIPAIPITSPYNSPIGSQEKTEEF